jgi:hypothetical protein
MLDLYLFKGRNSSDPFSRINQDSMAVVRTIVILLLISGHISKTQFRQSV